MSREIEMRTGSKILLLIAGIGVLVLANLWAAPALPPMKDFDQTFYPAIRYALLGQNPYTATYLFLFEETTGPSPAFFSPPWLLFLLLPFGLLPLPLARALWMTSMQLVTIAAIMLWAQRGLRKRWAPLLVLLPWSLISLIYGQVTPLLFLGAILAIGESAKAEHSVRSAGVILLGLILLGLKPQLGLWISLPLFIQLLWQRDQRVLLLIVMGGSFVALVLLFWAPWLLPLLETPPELPTLYWSSTLERELALRGLPLWSAWGVRALVTLTMLVWLFWDHRIVGRDSGPPIPSDPWWAAWFAAVLILTPYVRSYDHILLIPILGYLLASFKWGFIIFVMLVFAYTQLPGGELGSVVAPLTAWLLYVPRYLLIHKLWRKARGSITRISGENITSER